MVPLTTDLLDRIVFVGDVMDYDQQMVENLEAARQAVADAKAGLETSQAEQQDAKAALESQEAELAKDEAAVDAAIAEINSQADPVRGPAGELRPRPRIWMPRLPRPRRPTPTIRWPQRGRGEGRG